MSEVVQLHRAPIQNDIVGGLRNLADQIEQGAVEDMPIISTVVVALGHSKVTMLDNNEIEQDADYAMFSWGPRKDIFTIRGILSTICNRL